MPPAEEAEAMEQAVTLFVARYLKFNPHRLHPSTRLLQDMGVEGETARKLLDAFSNQFDVDMTGFRFERHFGPQVPFNFFVWAVLILYGCFTQEYGWKPITIDKLVEVAQRRRW